MISPTMYGYPQPFPPLTNQAQISGIGMGISADNSQSATSSFASNAPILSTLNHNAQLQSDQSVYSVSMGSAAYSDYQPTSIYPQPEHLDPSSLVYDPTTTSPNVQLYYNNRSIGSITASQCVWVDSFPKPTDGFFLLQTRIVFLSDVFLACASLFVWHELMRYVYGRGWLMKWEYYC